MKMSFILFFVTFCLIFDGIFACSSKVCYNCNNTLNHFHTDGRSKRSAGKMFNLNLINVSFVLN